MANQRFMTELQKRCADFIINFYKEKQGVSWNKESLLSEINQKEFPLHEARYVLHMLLYKRLLAASDGVVKQYLFLTDKGWAYESYDKLLAEEKAKERLEKRQIRSSIRTNASVRSTNNIQKLALFLTVATSVLTLWVSLLTYKKTDVTTVNVAAPKV